ncbi:SoxR (2Fe-2S) reducing system protein RsxB [Gammaproteobacteria bacterium]
MSAVFTAVTILTILALFLGTVLGYASIRFRVKGSPLVEKINQVLPQTQCGQCGFAGCKGYSEALAENRASIDRCPPGGQVVVVALANLLNRPVPSKQMSEKTEEVASIRETICIGCTLCQQACPVDAILGAAKQIHTVIVEECTGCGLCVAPCPVDCILMVPIQKDLSSWKWPSPKLYSSEMPQNAA